MFVFLFNHLKGKKKDLGITMKRSFPKRRLLCLQIDKVRQSQGLILFSLRAISYHLEGHKASPPGDIPFWFD